MSLLIESIRIYNGRVYNIQWHNWRCNQSRKKLFNSSKIIDLRSFIHVPNNCKKGLFKCRISYNDEIQSVEFSPYSIRTIENVALISVQETNYDHKYLERNTLQQYRERYTQYDEIIMVKHGLVTDAYYYNIVLQKDGLFTTPKAPILCGVQRQKLLDKNIITIADISPKSLLAGDYIHLVNALTPLHRITVEPSSLSSYIS